MTRYARLLVVGVLGCTACSDSGGGGTSPGDGAIAGTLDGRAWPIMSAISSPVPDGQNQFGIVLLSTKPDLCDRLTSNAAYANEQLMLVLLADAGMQGSSYTASAPTAPGTYTIEPISSSSPPPPHVAGLEVQYIFDGSCNEATNDSDEAMSGTLDLTAVAGGRYTATFDAMFASDHLTGNFSTESCPALASFEIGEAQPSPSTCLQ